MFFVIVYLKPETSSDKILKKTFNGREKYITVIWTGSLTKTNRENINVKHNIF